MFKGSKFILAAVMTAALAACGGGTDATTPVTGATANLVAAVNPAVANAVANTPFVFSSGVPGLGTTAATTVQFTNTATTPAFSIASGGNTATGVTTFGSCIFTVTASTFTPPSALVNGARITIPDCNLTVATAGAPANAAAISRTVTLSLGTTVSGAQAATVTISPTGAVTVNGLGAGTVITGTVTGA